MTLEEDPQGDLMGLLAKKDFQPLSRVNWEVLQVLYGVFGYDHFTLNYLLANFVFGWPDEDDLSTINLLLISETSTKKFVNHVLQESRVRVTGWEDEKDSGEKEKDSGVKSAAEDHPTHFVHALGEALNFLFHFRISPGSHGAPAIATYFPARYSSSIKGMCAIQKAIVKSILDHRLFGDLAMTKLFCDLEIVGTVIRLDEHADDLSDKPRALFGVEQPNEAFLFPGRMVVCHHHFSRLSYDESLKYGLSHFGRYFTSSLLYRSFRSMSHLTVRVCPGSSEGYSPTTLKSCLSLLETFCHTRPAVFCGNGCFADPTLPAQNAYFQNLGQKEVNYHTEWALGEVYRTTVIKVFMHSRYDMQSVSDFETFLAATRQASSIPDSSVFKPRFPLVRRPYCSSPSPSYPPDGVAEPEAGAEYSRKRRRKSSKPEKMEEVVATVSFK